MASGQEIQGQARDQQAQAGSAEPGEKSVEFTDVFGDADKKDPKRDSNEARKGPALSGIGEEWGILSWRRRNFEQAGESVKLAEPVATHLKDTLQQTLRRQAKISTDAPLSEAQRTILSDAEAALKNPKTLLNLFTDKAQENSPTKSLVEQTLNRMGIKVEANPSEKSFSIYASRDSLTLNNEREADSVKITVRHNRFGAPSMLFEQITADKEAKIGPQPIEKEPEKLTRKTLSLEDGRSWLADQYNKSLEFTERTAQRAKERADAAAREQRDLADAANRRAENADPIIQKAVATALEQKGKSGDSAEAAKTIHDLLRLDKDAAKAIFKSHATHGLEIAALENMGLQIEMLTDGSALAIHKFNSKDALLIEPNGNTRLAKKVDNGNGWNLDLDHHRFSAPKDRQSMMSDFLEKMVVEGRASADQAQEKVQFEKRYARLLIDKDQDKTLAERIATQKINTNAVKNTAIDYLASMSMGRSMQNPAALDSLMKPSPEGSRAETERLYFESLLRQAGLKVNVNQGGNALSGDRWLTMSTTTLDGRTFHASAGGDITAFGAAGKAIDITPRNVAESFQLNLRCTEHKAAVLDNLSTLLPRLGLQALSAEDRKSIESLVERTNAKSAFPTSYQERRLQDSLGAQMKDKGLDLQFSADRSYLLISSPKQEKRLAINLNPESAGQNSSSTALLISPPKGDKSNSDLSKADVDKWVKDGSPESLRAWLLESKLASDEYARERARSLESAKVEVMKDRARLEYLVEERLATLLPDTAQLSKLQIPQEKAKEIRQQTAKLISAISSLSKDGIPPLSPPNNVPWKLVGQEPNSPERQYFEACLRASGFSGRLIVDKETGKQIEGYRLTEAGSLREINLPTSSLGFGNSDFNYEPLTAADRESYRKTVDSSLKVIETVNNAMARMQDGGASISARDRLAVVENIRQTILYAQGNSGADGLARLAGTTPEQRTLTNSILRRAGIDMYIFNHNASGFAEGMPLQDLSFRFTDPKSGKASTLELGVELDPHNVNNVLDVEARTKASDGQANTLRGSLAESLSAFVIEGKAATSSDAAAQMPRRGAIIELNGSVDRAKINALVESAAQARGLSQPELERTAASVLRSLAGIEGSGFDSPVPSQQLKSILGSALENAGFQSAIVSSKELGLSGPDGHTVDLYIYQSGEQGTLIRYKFDQTGKSKGQPEVFQTASDKDGRPLMGRLSSSPEANVQIAKQFSEGLQAAEIAAPAASRTEIAEQHAKARTGERQTINIYLEKGKPSPAKSPAQRFTDAEFEQTVRKKLDSAEVQVKGLTPTQIETVKSQVQDFLQAVKAISEKGAKGVSNDISTRIPWANEPAQQKAFVELLKAMDCDVRITEETVAHKTRTDTKYNRLMVGLPGAQAAAVVDSEPYLEAGSDAKAPLALRSKTRMRLLAYDAVDFKGEAGVSDGARALTNSKAAKAFAEFFGRMSANSPNRVDNAVEPAATKLRVNGKAETDQAKVLLEREHIDSALAEAERQARANLSKATDESARKQAEGDLQNVESWKGALANPDMSGRARQSLAEQLAVRAQETGRNIRQPAVLLAIVGSIILSTAASAQTNTQAPFYVKK